MRHRIFHSYDLTSRLPEYAAYLGVSVKELQETWAWMLDNEVGFEQERGGVTHYSISYINIESRISNPIARNFFAKLRDELPANLIPIYGINWPTFKDRWLRTWELAYNILINKIPSHNVRLAWLRLGGAKIGKGSSVWRGTEVLGIDSINIGTDSVVGWDCLLDGRAGILIGDHVTIASHTLIIAGGHDIQAPEFWAVAGPPVQIGDYAWIASRAMLNASVGEGAVVAGQSVVTKPVPAYSIVGGNPAKVIGERPKGLNYKVGGKGLFTLFH